MEWTPLLAVIVGSTGIIGAVAAAVQLSRRARLTRAIKAATKAAESVADSSQTRAVLQQAIEMDTLRLAAGSIITVPSRYLTLHVTIIAAPIVAFAVSGLGAGVGVLRKAPYTIDPVVLQWAGLALAGIWVFAMGSLIGHFAAVYRMREDWVAAAMLAQSPPVRTPRMREAARGWTAHRGDAIQGLVALDPPVRSGGAD